MATPMDLMAMSSVLEAAWTPAPVNRVVNSFRHAETQLSYLWKISIQEFKEGKYKAAEEHLQQCALHLNNLTDCYTRNAHLYPISLHSDYLKPWFRQAYLEHLRYVYFYEGLDTDSQTEKERCFSSALITCHTVMKSFGETEETLFLMAKSSYGLNKLAKALDYAERAMAISQPANRVQILKFIEQVQKEMKENSESPDWLSGTSAAMKQRPEKDRSKGKTKRRKQEEGSSKQQVQTDMPSGGGKPNVSQSSKNTAHRCGPSRSPGKSDEKKSETEIMEDDSVIQISSEDVSAGFQTNKECAASERNSLCLGGARPKIRKDTKQKKDVAVREKEKTQQTEDRCDRREQRSDSLCSQHLPIMETDLYAEDRAESVCSEASIFSTMSEPALGNRHLPGLTPNKRRRKRKKKKKSQADGNIVAESGNKELKTTVDDAVQQREPKTAVQGQISLTKPDITILYSRTSGIQKEKSLPEAAWPQELSHMFELKFVCNSCYQKVGHGNGGRQLHPNLLHMCKKDILLARKSGDSDHSWARVRARTNDHAGNYIICRDFLMGKPCAYKLGEEKCNFPHSVIEQYFWQQDRQGTINLGYILANNRPETTAGAKGILERRQSEVKVPAKAGGHQMAVPSAAPNVWGQPKCTPGGAMPILFAMDKKTSSADFEESKEGVNMEEDREDLPYPFRKKYDYRLACALQCYAKTGSGKDGRKYNQSLNHTCQMDILLVRKCDTKGRWSWIRPRPSDFDGDYRLCKEFNSNKPCSFRPEEKCSFPHTEEEKYFWELDRTEQFLIKNFIQQKRNSIKSEGPRQAQPVVPLVNVPQENPSAKRKATGNATTGTNQKFPLTSHEFKIACRQCTKAVKGKLCTVTYAVTKSHKCDENMLIVRRRIKEGDSRTASYWIRIRERLNHFYFVGHYRMCKHVQSTHTTSHWEGCTHAHSEEERQLWTSEKNKKFSISKFILDNRAEQHRLSTIDDFIARHGGTVANICQKCFSQGVISKKKRHTRVCIRETDPHVWTENTVLLVHQRQSKEKFNIAPIRSPPGAASKVTFFQLCRSGEICPNKKQCGFAHSKMERDFWMVERDTEGDNVRQKLVHECQQKTKNDPTVSPTSDPRAKPLVDESPAYRDLPALPTGGEEILYSRTGHAKTAAVASSHKWSSPLKTASLDTDSSQFYCEFCGVVCNSLKQLELHCASRSHKEEVNTDQDRSWEYRQPPWGQKDYKLCPQHERNGSCEYSHTSVDHNRCMYAHGQDELDEWRERRKYRVWKKKKAKESNVYSFMDILNERQQNEETCKLLCEEMESVTLACDEASTFFTDKKDCRHAWHFRVTVKNGQRLLKVALLEDRDRLHFSITGANTADKNRLQIVEAETLQQDRDADNCLVYQFNIAFEGGMFGSFKQWVVLDFGHEPHLVRKLYAEIGSQSKQEEIQKLQQELDFQPWTAENRDIVRYEGATISDEFSRKLFTKYKAPSSAAEVVNQNALSGQLNRYNYVEKMHKFLQLEELQQKHIMARYNLEVEVETMKHIQDGVFIAGREGQFFVRLPLENDLSPDTDAGQLILDKCTTVLVAPPRSPSRKVYEALVVRKSNFGYDGRGKNHVYIILSPPCVKELELQDKSKVSLEVQFQMERLPFCQQHFALDELRKVNNVALLFPDLKRDNTTSKQTHIVSSRFLNQKQTEAAEFVMLERKGYTAPLILYGPFGTGKTETLIQATVGLVTKKPDSKVLICTHSNSAAELFIGKPGGFDDVNKQLEENGQNPIKIRRILFKGRELRTVPEKTRKYCLMTQDKQQFLTPDKDDIQNHHIVIATNVSSLSLSKLMLKGHFTHIFLDEAGQAQETEAIIPLALASEKTCIVLAGDHKQVSPKIYSAVQHQQNFHASLLQRLFNHYSACRTKYAEERRILLTQNYRTHPTILKFLSDVFYDGEDNLVSCSDEPTCQELSPVAFYCAMGEEKQNEDSTSFFNAAEINEVVTRVQHLCEAWPNKWGEFNQEHIGVVAWYTDQVNQIRTELRRKRLRNIRVETLRNVQGMEFRALFISTVRTRKVTESLGEYEDEPDEDYGFLSDEKLLNTAMTRARGHVAVIGHPLALCGIGKCQRIWLEYLKYCEKNQSLFPGNVTVDNIQMELEAQGLENAIEESTESDVSEEEYDTLADDDTMENRQHDDSQANCARQLSLEINSVVEPDEILVQLAKEADKDRARPSEELGGKSNVDSSNPIKIECVRIEEEQGFAIIYHRPNWWMKKDQPQSRNLLSAEDEETEFDRNRFLDEQPAEEQEFSEEVLKRMLQTEPTKYKHCVVHIVSFNVIFAKVKDSDDPIKEVSICGRRKCGQAFDGDEVVVEILNQDVVGGKEPMRHKGQVVGILRRLVDPRYRTFVCMVDPACPGNMIPINVSLPILYNLTNKERLDKVKKGLVSVYRFTQAKEILFHYYDKIDFANPRNKLYLVRYLKWNSKHNHPLGIVVDILPPGDTLENGMRILNIEYDLHHKFKKEVTKEAKQVHKEFSILPRAVYKDRVDLRNKFTFSIDPAGSEDLDDALGVEIKEGKVHVWVHIADVSHYITKGSVLDVEASTRATTYYPTEQEPIHMLPEMLSGNLCSLKPFKDCLAISVQFIFNQDDPHVDEIDPVLSVIHSNHRLTYEEAEDRINHDNSCGMDYLTYILQKLDSIASKLRKARIGNEFFCNDVYDESKACTPKAHNLVEEFMILANHRVSKMLIKHFPQCTPLKRQLPPDEEELTSWKKKYFQEAQNSFKLRKALSPFGSVCNCQGKCICDEVAEEWKQDENVYVLTSVWQYILEMQRVGDFQGVKDMIMEAEHHPQQALALLHLHMIQERAAYICSGAAANDIEKNHYSLNLTTYTHFTSPIRRYIDIVVHRLLKAAMKENPSPYTEQEVSEICEHCTDVSIKAKKYEDAAQVLNWAVSLRNGALMVHPVVEAFDDAAISMRFPLPQSARKMPHPRRKIGLNHLDLSRKPHFNEAEQTLYLAWEQRIYDVNSKRPASQLQRHLRGGGSDVKEPPPPKKLNPGRHVIEISKSTWVEMLNAVQKSDMCKMDKLIQEVQASIGEQLAMAQRRYAVDVTSEETSPSVKHFVAFDMTLSHCSVMQLQLVSHLHRGLLMPHIQLVNLTPTLDMCVEHRQYPVDCFASRSVKPFSHSSYSSVCMYQKMWLPVLAMEAAKCAMNNDISAIIHNVKIMWSKDGWHGVFELGEFFCKDRHLEFNNISSGDSKTALFEHLEEMLEGLQDQNEDGSSPASYAVPSKHRFFDYLCIRYAGQASDDLAQQEERACWVGHCRVTNAQQVKLKETNSEEKSKLRVCFKVHQAAVPLLQSLRGKMASCTIQWIPKTLPDLRMEAAVSKVESGGALATGIALGSRLGDPGKHDVLHRSSDVPGLLPANTDQHSAVLKAMNQCFTLIQGPPGTGKTVTGVRLAYLLAQQNGKTHQLLYCGPSNKSVDVVADYLKKLPRDKCPIIIRMYSKRITRQDFPVPQEPTPPNRKQREAYSTEKHRDIALHHLIRQKGKMHSGEICKYDEMFRSSPDKVSKQDIERYNKIVSEAEVSELKTAQIILVTCITAGDPKLNKAISIPEEGKLKNSKVTAQMTGTRTKQVIIDESGMSMEPESMVPIVSCQPSQVILIGDHKQLQPIIIEPSAQKLGLGISLFERYANKQGTVMLKQQYRMHKSICAFPSEKFYDNQLKSATLEQDKGSRLNIWPGGCHKPLVFCHVEGKEETLTVTTAEGNEQSKSNVAEVYHAVRIAKKLKLNWKVKGENIKILSQYRAQCAEIQKKLDQEGHKDISVGTVVTSQGSEWDYVILSTVRSLPQDEIERNPTSRWRAKNMGFICDPNQVNVGITRAKKGMIIIGNEHLLSVDQLWHDLVAHYRQQKAFVMADRFLP